MYICGCHYDRTECPVLSKCVSSGKIRVLGIYLWKIHVTVTNLHINLKVDIPENSAHHFLFIKVIRNRSMDSLNPKVMDKFCYQGYAKNMSLIHEYFIAILTWHYTCIH